MSVGVSIGAALAAARREAGMSVEQVSAATRIRRTIVSAIENDDFSLCGGDFYARAHIRSVAAVVGADPAPLLERYDRAQPPERGPMEPVRTELARGRGGPNWSAAMAAALALVLAVAGYRLVAGDDDGTEGPVAQATATVAAPPSPRPSTARPRPAPPGNAVAGVPRSGVTVQLRAVGGASWVRITNAAGRELYQGLLGRGATKTVTDPVRVRLVVGNAGAVALVVNGKSLGPSGRPGAVARVDFGPGDPAAG